MRNINEAIKNNWKIDSILFSGERNLSSWATDIIQNIKVEDGIYELTNNLMDDLSDKEDSSELIAIISMKDDCVSRIELSKNPLIVVFDRPSNKGNLGTIIRSCDAFCCDGLIITGHAVDLYDSETIRSTTGSFFKMPIIRMESHKEVLDFVKSLKKKKYQDIQIIGTSAKSVKRIDEQNLQKPTVLIIGNETKGLSEGYKEICDELLTIPIGGSASSLNVACAISTCLYEIRRQREFK